jgi:hypothetical protein
MEGCPITALIGLQEVDVPRTGRKSAIEGGKVYHTYEPTAFTTQEISVVVISLKRLSRTPRSQRGRKD